MVTTLGSFSGVTADISTATNLPSSMSASRSSSSGSTQHHGEKKHKEGNVTVGLILPHTSFGVREYIRSVKEAVEKLTKSRGPKLNFLKRYEFSPRQVHSVMMTLTPSPTGKYTVCSDKIMIYCSSSPMAVFANHGINRYWHSVELNSTALSAVQSPMSSSDRHFFF